MSDLCNNCKHRQLRSRMIGKKFSMNILSQIQQLRSPRNIETPYINVIDYLQKIHQKQEIQDNLPSQITRVPTHISKQKTELQVEDPITATSRFDQFPITQCLSRGASASKIKSSAFYKMKQMSYSTKSSSQKRKNLDIGPMFNQVSKYVQPMRPQTVRSGNVVIEDVFRSTPSTRQELLRHSKSEVTLRLPVSNKLSEVQSLMKRE